MHKFIFTALPLAAALLSGGCFSPSGPELYPVTGMVTIDGTPLVGANVVFHPQEQGGSSYGGTDENGKFSLYYTTGKPGAVAGTHRVEIQGGSKQGTFKAVEQDPLKPAPMPVEATAGKAIDVVVGESVQNHFQIDL